MNSKKIAMISEMIAKNAVGSIILFRPDELVMSLGYRPHFGLSVAVCYEKSKPILYIPALEPKQRLPQNITVKTYPWGETNEDPFKLLYEMIRADIKVYGDDSKPVSLVKSIGNTSPTILSAEAPPLPSDFIHKLSGVSSGGFKDIDQDILGLYDYKTKEDIEGLRLANKVAGIAIDVFYDALQVGLTEAEVSAKMEYAVRTQIGKFGVKYASGFAQVQSGINGADGGRYNWVTDNKLKDSDFVMTEFAVVVNGYWADITRTGKVGVVNEEDLRLYGAVEKALKASIEAIREGVVAEDLHNIASHVLDKENFLKYFTHGLGHAVGFRYHDPGIRITSGVKDRLKEGMVITIEPGIYDASFGGIRIEENVLVTKDGYEILSDFNRGLKREEG